MAHGRHDPLGLLLDNRLLHASGSGEPHNRRLYSSTLNNCVLSQVITVYRRAYQSRIVTNAHTMLRWVGRGDGDASSRWKMGCRRLGSGAWRVWPVPHRWPLTQLTLSRAGMRGTQCLYIGNFPGRASTRIASTPNPEWFSFIIGASAAVAINQGYHGYGVHTYIQQLRSICEWILVLPRDPPLLTPSSSSSFFFFSSMECTAGRTDDGQHKCQAGSDHCESKFQASPTDQRYHGARGGSEQSEVGWSARGGVRTWRVASPPPSTLTDVPGMSSSSRSRSAYEATTISVGPSASCGSDPRLMVTEWTVRPVVINTVRVPSRPKPHSSSFPRPCPLGRPSVEATWDPSPNHNTKARLVSLVMRQECGLRQVVTGCQCWIIKTAPNKHNYQFDSSFKL